MNPQGAKNTSEVGYEILARVYGDLCAQKKMVCQADSLFPQGDTITETLNNYREVLRRAEHAGLTFKPGKTVICPKEIVLFGWKLKDSRWSPMAHTTASLSIAEKPTTVKGLRSFFFRFNQYVLINID